MIFMDGVGIGKRDYEYNPFYKLGFKTFTELLGSIPSLELPTLTKNDIYVFPVDASMGIPEIPLSGTGQTSIFCGFNASKLIGKHFGPYPYSALVPLIKDLNIFKTFIQKKKKVQFANAYPKAFFDYINSGRKRLSVTTLSCLMNGMKLNKISDLHSGKALSAEIDNSRLAKRMNYKLPIIKPETAANRLLRIGAQNHFTLFEIFHTDHLGHGRYIEYLEETIETLDRFLFHILTNLKKNMTLIVCSDHGNFEDLSTKMHTFNPALCITSGKNSEHLYKKIKSLYDIKPAIMEMYD